MKRASLVLVVLTLAISLSAVSSLSIGNVKAASSYEIEHVDHTITVMYNGYVLVNDTIQLSGRCPDSFLLAFPYEFGSYVVRATAYDADVQTNTFPVSLGEPLEGRSGFYGMKIDFSGSCQNFTVQVLLSNRAVSQEGQDTSLYTLTFPTFPSLAQTANRCNCSIVLPQKAAYVEGTIDNLTYYENNLSEFTYNSSTVTFQVDSGMEVLDINQLNREIRVNESGDVAGSDSYYITNRALKTMDTVEVLIPIKAFDVSARDQFGQAMDRPVVAVANTTRYFIDLTRPLEPNKSTRFIVDYRLPSDFVERQTGNTYALHMNLFQDIDYYINVTTVTFVLPEGARLQTLSGFSASDSYTINRGVFQEEVTLSERGTLSLNSLAVTVAYEYNLLWLAFRPTIWAIVLAAILSGAIVFVRRPKAAVPMTLPTPAMRLRPEYLRSFVDSYEEKLKIASELDSLEIKARKGKIPRRRYKIQSRTLKTRLDSLSTNLSEAKDKLRGAGGHYANLVRELEVAETELNEVEANVRSIEARHSRGELSLEAYRKLLGDYERRKEKTETTLDGILLRLREETR